MVKFKGISDRLSGSRPGLGDTVALIRRYVLQETLEPIKNIGRALGFSLLGGLSVGLGCVFLLIAFLRILQTETSGTFGGNWSFAPYLITAAVGGAVIGGCVVLGFRHRQSQSDEGF